MTGAQCSNTTYQTVYSWYVQVALPGRIHFYTCVPVNSEIQTMISLKLLDFSSVWNNTSYRSFFCHLGMQKHKNWCHQKAEYSRKLCKFPFQLTHPGKLSPKRHSFENDRIKLALRNNKAFVSKLTNLLVVLHHQFLRTGIMLLPATQYSKSPIKSSAQSISGYFQIDGLTRFLEYPTEYRLKNRCLRSPRSPKKCLTSSCPKTSLRFLHTPIST